MPLKIEILYRHEGKAFIVVKVFRSSFWRTSHDPVVTGPVFSLHELSTDIKNKTKIFTFKILVKPRNFVVKHHINIIYII